MCSYDGGTARRVADDVRGRRRGRRPASWARLAGQRPRSRQSLDDERIGTVRHRSDAPSDSLLNFMLSRGQRLDRLPAIAVLLVKSRRHAEYLSPFMLTTGRWSHPFACGVLLLHWTICSLNLVGIVHFYPHYLCLNTIPSLGMIS